MQLDLWTVLLLIATYRSYEAVASRQHLADTAFSPGSPNRARAAVKSTEHAAVERRATQADEGQQDYYDKLVASTAAIGTRQKKTAVLSVTKYDHEFDREPFREW